MQLASFIVAILLVEVDVSSSLSPLEWWNETVVESRRLSPPSLQAGLLDVHIPKTGGTSLTELWLGLVRSRHLCASLVFKTHIPTHNLTRCDESARVRVLSGHASMDIAAASEVLSVPRVSTIMILREPLSRIVSFANFVGVHLEDFEKYVTLSSGE